MSQQANDQALLASCKPMRTSFQAVGEPAQSLQSLFMATRNDKTHSFILLSPFVKQLKSDMGTLFYALLSDDKRYLIFQKAEPDYDKGDLWRAAYKSDFVVHFEYVDFLDLKPKVYSEIAKAFNDEVKDNDDFAFIACARYSSVINGVVIDIGNTDKKVVDPKKVRDNVYPWTCDEGY